MYQVQPGHPGSVWCVMLVKDEIDVVTATITHLLEEGVDGVVVADNNSTDGTWAALMDLAERTGKVDAYDDPDPGYYQSRKTGWLADIARLHGAEWIVPVDADEVWGVPPNLDSPYLDTRNLADTLRAVDPAVQVVSAMLFNHFPTGQDEAEGRPFERIVHRQPLPSELPKVAFRFQHGAVVWQGNHGVSLPEPGPGRLSLLEVRHFPYRSAEQFTTKAINGAAAYKAAPDLPADMGAHWRAYGEIYERGGQDALVEHYHRWFCRPSPEDFDPPLVWDPAPFGPRRARMGG